MIKIREIELSGIDSDNRRVIINVPEYELLSAIKICLVTRRNKNLGIRLARFYMELGKECKENLIHMGLDLETVNSCYERIKKIIGEIH